MSVSKSVYIIQSQKNACNCCHYRAPTPVNLFVSHPIGVCNDILRGPVTDPKASGFADWNDCFLACAEASARKNKIHEHE